MTNYTSTFVDTWHKILGRQPAHFLHIGKTGGTAIKNALEDSLITKKFYIIPHNHNFRLKDVPVGHKIFFCTRDPITRFVSGFYSRKRQGRPRYNRPWSEEERQSFLRFQTPTELAMGLKSNDMDFRNTATRAMQNIGHLNEFYWNWFGNEEYFKTRISDVLFILQQETLDADFEELKLRLQLAKDLKLRKDSYSAHRNDYPMEASLSHEAVESLRQWYAQDYLFLKFLREENLIT